MRVSFLTRSRLMALLATALVTAVAVTLMMRGRSDTPAATTEPMAPVATAIAAEGSLAGAAVAYGTVTAAPHRILSIAVLYDAIVKSLGVRDGDAVREGAALLTVSRTPATALQDAQASSALAFARQDLARMQRLFADQLASNDQLAAATKALSDAQSQVDQQHKMGADQAEVVLRAPFDGVIGGLTANAGDRLQANTTVATLASRSDLVVQLGVEASEARKLAPGAAVKFTGPVDGAMEIAGKLISVGAMVDPATRFVKAVADIPATDASYVSLGVTLLGHISLPVQKGVLVPRGALLEDGAGTYVYADAGGKAHRLPVRILVETDAQVLIGQGLAPGTRVIVSGNAALAEGVAVQEAKP